MSGVGLIELSNPLISDLREDHLYHLGLNTKTHLLKKLFGDVKFVCMGGAVKRMRDFACLIAQTLEIETGPNFPEDLTGHADRYSMFKAGPVLCVNHGIGIPSLLVVLQEVIKLLYHAQCTANVIFFRIGTSGGVGVEAGTVVLSESAVNECLQDYLEMTVAGLKIRRPCFFDQQIIEEIKSLCHRNFDDFPLKIGKTLTTMDFYEGQGRLDGAICHYDESRKRAYLKQLSEAGVVNIEMEALAFGAILHQCNIKACVVSVVLLDRLTGDQVELGPTLKHQWEARPQLLVASYIKEKLIEQLQQ